MPADAYQFGPFCLEVRERRLLRDGQPVALRPKAFDTLCVLVENHGRLLRKDELMRAVWPDTVVEENNLDHNISLLRKALGQRRGQTPYIETVPRQGYRFVAPVTATVGALMPPAIEPPPLLVGRSAELATLGSALARARAGTRQVVFVTGEAGAGKTTLVRAFVAQAAATAPVRIAFGQCVEHLTAGEPYMSVLEAVGQLARGPQAAAFVELLRRHAPSWLLQLPALAGAAEMEDIRARLGTVTRERMLREMVDALEASAATEPFVLVFEDLHWSDHSSVDLLLRLARGAAPARLLVLATYRPTDARSQHPLHAAVQELVLRNAAQELALPFLSAASIREYLSARFGSPLHPALGELLHRRTAGQPLFVTAVVNAWQEKGHLRQTASGWEALAPPEALAAEIPETLRQLIEYRFAQLSPEELLIVEAAAVAGAEFSSAAVAAALDRPHAEAAEALASLARRGTFLRRTGTAEWPDGSVADMYAFVHGLYQEVVYAVIAAGRRVRLHQQLGAALERACAGSERRHAAELARHFAEARDARRAIRYFAAAAEDALHRNAHPEAILHLRRGLEMVRRFPDPTERNEREFEIQAMLAPALVAVRGFADREAEQAYRRAAELAASSAAPARRFPAVFGLATMLELRGEFRASQSLMEEHLPAQEQDGAFVVDARDLLACSRFHQGAFEDALAHGQRGVEAYTPDRPFGLNSCFGENAVVGCHAWAALSLWFLGNPDQALARARLAVELAARPGNLYSLAAARNQLAIVTQLRGEVAETARCAAASFELATQQGFGYSQAVAQSLVGWAVTRSGESERGVAMLREGLEGCRRAGAELDRAYYLALLADVLLLEGRHGEALAALDEGEARVRDSRSYFYEAELLRLRALVMLARGERGEAARLLDSALDVARQQKARSLELRIRTAQAELAPTTEARSRLAETYAAITEGRDTADLRRAAELLAESGAAAAAR